TFMQSFGKNGRFMTTALNNMNHKDLMNFFTSLKVDTHIPDGFRIFPVTHNSTTIINALQDELNRLNIEVICDEKVIDINIEEQTKKVSAVKTQNNTYKTKNILLATGGLGYPKLGASGDGHTIVKNLGHTITKIYPAMMPLDTKETWVSKCTAHTIAKVTIKVNLPNRKLKKLTATGDLIFTKKGIRGPVVLDFAREITPYIEEFKEVPILVNLTKGMDENDIIQYIKKELIKSKNGKVVDILKDILPYTVLFEILSSIDINIQELYKNLLGTKKEKLIKILAWTPLTINGHDGFDKAMITRGGVSLKEIDPNSMQSKVIDGLYFAGEILDLDGPCGGYNLQWSFSSGYLAGKLL
ncbi:MAG: aminoacetone oxidase family FAD-binding enzyme, partial [Campylobacterota bacterium]|nr:aminoacetone oxidase family FAD-binding enzyme [Campylobacterota bacterium]